MYLNEHKGTLKEHGLYFLSCNLRSKSNDHDLENHNNYGTKN
ncbi:hypothetical protein IWQ47_002333 [Aquimarina sp. EL_43]|nr:hypothetical protein [Aquimarina sp. EL_35]MBG6150984.1 hypothetical protein [Aquimarina sp. EL_32]MBG6169259.1 hypothetical protein [Aquimarina sp. EL_43]